MTKISIARLARERRLGELDKSSLTISAGFIYPEDEDLLYWIYNRPENFASFVRRTLYNAMQAETDPQPAPALDEAALTRLIRRELQRALQTAQLTASHLPAAEEPDLVDELEKNFANLF